MVPTLEVLTLTDDHDEDDVKGGWIKHPSMLERYYPDGFVIKDHLVVGDQIYARVHHWSHRSY